MKPTPLNKQSTWRRRLLVGFGTLSLALLLVVLVKTRSSRDSIEGVAAPASAVRSLQPVAQDAVFTLPSTSSASALPALQGAPSKTPGLVDEEVMLSAQKRWVERQSGKDMQIVQSQKVRDFPGESVPLNVRFSSKRNTGERP